LQHTKRENYMKIQVKDLKVGHIFTDSGITVKVEEIKRDDLVNGSENYMITGTSIDFNKKLFKRMTIGIPCYYSKKAETIITVK
jgi:hypothetical protein